MALLLALISASLCMTCLAHERVCDVPGTTFRHESDCSFYYMCDHDNRPQIFICTGGKRYNHEQGVCDEADNVDCPGEDGSGAETAEAQDLKDFVHRLLPSLEVLKQYASDKTEENPPFHESANDKVEEIPIEHLKTIERRDEDGEGIKEDSDLETSSTIRAITHDDSHDRVEQETETIHEQHEGEISTESDIEPTTEHNDGDEEANKDNEDLQDKVPDMAEESESDVEGSGDRIDDMEKKQDTEGRIPIYIITSSDQINERHAESIPFRPNLNYYGYSSSQVEGIIGIGHTNIESSMIEIEKQDDIEGEKQDEIEGEKHDDEGEKQEVVIEGEKQDVVIEGEKQDEIEGEKQDEIEGEKHDDEGEKQEVVIEGEKQDDIEGEKQDEIVGEKQEVVIGAEKHDDIVGEKQDEIEGEKQEVVIEGEKHDELEGEKHEKIEGEKQDEIEEKKHDNVEGQSSTIPDQGSINERESQENSENGEHDDAGHKQENGEDKEETNVEHLVTVNQGQVQDSSVKSAETVSVGTEGGHEGSTEGAQISE